MADQQIKYVVTADPAGFIAGSKAVENGLKAMRDQVTSMGDSARNVMAGVTQQFTSLRNIVAAGILGGAAREVVQVMSQFEQLEIQLRSVMGSVEAGDKAFAWIKQFAKDTPFEVQGVTQAFLRLKNMGMDPMGGTLQAIADQAAKSGQGMLGLERISLAVGQAWTKQKLQGEEVMQLLEAGVPAWDLLSKATGKSAADLQDLATKGRLGRDAIELLVEAMGRAASGGAGAQMASLAGQWSNLKDNIQGALDIVRKEGGLEPMKQGLTTVNEAISAVSGDGRLKSWARTASQAFQAISDTMGNVARMVVASVGDLASAVGRGLGEIARSIGSTFGAEPISKVQFFANVLKVIEIAVLGLRYTFQLLAEITASAIEQMVGWVMRFASTAERALALDFSGAKAAWQQGGQFIQDNIQERMGNIVRITREAREQLDAIVLRPLGAAAGAPTPPPSGGSSGSGGRTNLKLQGGKDGKEDPSRMSEFEAGLAAMKAAAAQEDALREYSKQQELTYWRDILASQKLSQADKLAIVKKTSELQLQVLREEAQQAQQIEAGKLAGRMKASEDAVALAKAEGEALVASGDMTRTQLLEQEVALEMGLQQVRRQSLMAKLEMVDPSRDPVKYAEVSREIEEAERQHQVKMANIRGQLAGESAKESGRIWDSLATSMTSLWDKGIQAMMNGTLTWRNAMKAIGSEMTMWFAKEVVGEIVKKWLAGEAAKIAGMMGFTAAQKALNKVAAVDTVATKSVEATAVIGMNAGEAASGAAASQASIPYVGPILAAAAFAAIMAMVMGAKSSIPSAAGGFDIPAGMNPLTQLHEEEMVLPAHIANPMRDMLAAGGSAGAGTVNVEVKGTPMPGGYFMMHRSEIVKAIKAARKDLAF